MAPRTFRPVTFQETVSRYRTVNDAEGMGKALVERCDQAGPGYPAAARSCITLGESGVSPELVRADFVRALTSAGVFVRET